ncbi:helix-turn-helix transcriptional regulator (plasmid) [Priestia megaterium]|nr:helix-turn-helix transcriptional regulator [Priestia megaterium]
MWILHLLSRVNEISHELPLMQFTVSHQLRFLKSLQLINFRRRGVNSHYSYDDMHVIYLLNQAIEHANHKQKYIHLDFLYLKH